MQPPIIIPTATPSPSLVVEQATKVIDSFNSLGFGWRQLFVIFIALALIGLVIWSGRNSNSTALSVPDRVGLSVNQSPGF